MQSRTVISAIGNESAATAITAVLGLARGIVLARLILPEYFGVVAFAWVFVQLTMTLTHPHVGVEYHRERGPLESDDWALRRLTLRFIGIRALCFVIVIPCASYLFVSYDGLPVVLSFLAAASLIDSAVHSEIFRMRRRLQFRRLAIQSVASSVGISIIAPVIAFTGGGLWALVAEATLGVAIRASIVFGPFRMSYGQVATTELDIRRFLKTGRSAWLQHNLSEVINRVDDLMLGVIAGPSALGLYSKAFELGGSISRVVARPFSWALAPVWTGLRNDRKHLSQATFRTLYVLTRGAALASLPLIAFAPELVSIVLGDNWVDMIPAFRVFVAAAAVTAVVGVVKSNAFMVGQPSALTPYRVVQATVALPLFVVSAVLRDITLMAMSTLAVRTLFATLVFRYIRRFVDISLIRTLLPPVLVLSSCAGFSLFAEMFGVGGLETIALKLLVSVLLPAAVLLLAESRIIRSGWSELRIIRGQDRPRDYDSRSE